MAYKRQSNYKPFALKVLRTTKTDLPPEWMNEVKILNKLSHPNIIKIEETYKSDHHLVIVMELARGGELFKYVSISLFCDFISSYYNLIESQT